MPCAAPIAWPLFSVALALFSASPVALPSRFPHFLKSPFDLLLPIVGFWTPCKSKACWQEDSAEEHGNESSTWHWDASIYCSPGSTRKEESVSHQTLSSSFLHPNMKISSKEFDLVQDPVPTSRSVDTVVSFSESSMEATAPLGVHSKNQDSILDYSAKLEGISLEDFFTTQIKSQSTVAVIASTATENLFGTAEGLKVQNGLNDSFWDPLIEYTIPDGDHLTSSEIGVSKESLWSSKEVGEVRMDNLDDDDSWEGDFQSAAPASGILTNEGFMFGQFNTQAMQSGNDHDLFASPEMERETDVSDSFAKRQLSDVAERVVRDNAGLIMEDDNEIFVLHDYVGKPGPVLPASSERPQETDTERQMNLNDLFFGSTWQQNVAAPSMKDGIDEFADRTSGRRNSSNSAAFRNGQDLLQLSALQETKATTPDNGSHDGGYPYFKILDDVLGKEHQTQLPEKESEMVGSLLAQVHDLSFMLADKLVIRTDNFGKMNHGLDVKEQKLLF